MAYALTSLKDLHQHPYDDVIDVRSPAEFAEDHVPGAINLPALSDAERARVGTIYTQQSPFDARKIGAALVARNVAAHLDGPLAAKEGGWHPLVYCWRGGQRSGSVATILRAVGWRVDVVDGGYRSYRRLVVDMLHDRPLPHRFVLLDGYTGTAKTELLHRLGALGVQTLDLESFANHRGSVLGPHPAGQPSQKMFETRISAALSGFDPDRPVVVEAESSKIGHLLVPSRLWKAMCRSPRVEIWAPPDVRAEYLARAYGDLTGDPASLCAKLAQLIPIQGREVVEAWQALARQGAFVELARTLITHHYDTRYDKSRSRSDRQIVARLETPALGSADLDALAADLLRSLESTQR